MDSDTQTTLERASEPEVLHLKYDFPRSVELGHFTDSLSGLTEIHRIASARHGEEAKELRLFIREVRHGSIEIDLIEMARQAGGILAPIAAQTPLVFDIVERVKKFYDHYNGDKPAPEGVTKKELEAISRFLEPVAGVGKSSVNVFMANNIDCQVYIGSLEANAIQNGATRAIEEMKEPESRIVKETPLVWVQTDRTGATQGRTGMRAIVEVISSSPYRVYFPENDRFALKKAMLDDVDFPYKKTFIVDIETILVQGKLKYYKLLALHDVIDD